MVESLVLARELRGLTRLELARRLHITPEYMSMIERGVKTPGFKLSKRIADALGSTVDSLFFANATNETFDK